MTYKIAVRFVSVALLLGAFTAALSAQQVEVYPNAGGFWPRHTNYGTMKNDMKSEGIYGLKAGVFATQNFEVESSVGYINHFESRVFPVPNDVGLGVQPRTVYGVLYDLSGTYNFGERNMLNHRISPYVVMGLGGLTAEVRHVDSVIVAGGDFRIDQVTGASGPATGRMIRMDDGDTFLTVNYGAGLKAMNLWGPMGLRADIRGRTIPNFYGKSMHWPELTGGITFTWGER